uniref:Uncharacterized protein n=1 Tax=mine drainage metagenome TaxID=410659 RepID=E6QS85_9ZZZZ
MNQAHSGGRSFDKFNRQRPDRAKGS